MPVPMVRELKRLRDEAARILEVYSDHAHGDDQELRRKVTIDLDRFLMEHREEAILLMVDGLNQEIKRMVDKTKPLKKPTMWSRVSAVLRRKAQPLPERVNKVYEEK